MRITAGIVLSIAVGALAVSMSRRSRPGAEVSLEPAAALAPEQVAGPAPLLEVRHGERELAGVPAAATEEGSTDATVHLRVLLLDEGGRPHVNSAAQVLAVDEVGRERRAEPRRRGRYELPGLTPGRWWVRAESRGRRAAARELVLAPAPEGVELELVLAPVPMVRVLLLTPDGAPFGDPLMDLLYERPRALATRERPGPSIDARTEADARAGCGRFIGEEEARAGPGHLGVIELEREPLLWISLVVGQLVLDTQLLPAGADTVTFELDPARFYRAFGELRLRAVDAASAEPLSGAHARITQAAAGERDAVQTGERGLRLFPLPPGTWRLTVEAEGRAERRLEVRIDSGELRDLGDLALERQEPTWLGVRVHGPPGARRHELTWRREEAEAPEQRLRSPRDQVLFSATGERELRLQPGRWVLWARGEHEGAPLRSGARAVELLPGRTGLELELEPLAPLVLMPLGRRLELELRGRDPSLDRAPPLRLGEFPLRVELLPGSYELRVRERGAPERVLHLALPPAGATLRLD